MILTISDAKGISTILSLFVAIQRSDAGSMGDATALPDVMLKHWAMVFMKESCEICIIPSSLSHTILIPSRWLGFPKSCISKLPLISHIILSIDLSESAASVLEPENIMTKIWC